MGIDEKDPFYSYSSAGRPKLSEIKFRDPQKVIEYNK